MPQELLTNIVNLAVLILIGLAGYAVRQIYAGLPHDKQQLVSNLAGMVVPAIEQQFPDLGNPQKKIQAVNKVRYMLSALGIKGIPDNMIEIAIEAAVFAVKQQQNASSAPQTPNVPPVA